MTTLKMFKEICDRYDADPRIVQKLLQSPRFLRADHQLALSLHLVRATVLKTGQIPPNAEENLLMRYRQTTAAAQDAHPGVSPTDLLAAGFFTPPLIKRR